MDDRTVNERPRRRGGPDKPGLMTSEFSGAVAVAAAPYLIPGVPPETAARVSGLIGAVYVIARTALKIVALFRR